MTASTATALTEMVLKLTNGFTGTVLVPNELRDAPDDPDEVWARIRFEHYSRGQGSLANVEGKRRWASAGICTIELNFPYGKGAKDPYETAEDVCRLYEGKRTPSDVWFRDVRISEVEQPTTVKKYFRLDVVFEFQYDSVN